MSEVTICPPDHSHGDTLTCYTRHRCRCDECRAANRDRGFWRRHMIVAGKPRPFTLVPALGSRRRLQALMALGYSQSEIGRRVGVGQTTVSDWLTRGSVRRSTAATIAALYDELQDTPAIASTPEERMSVHRTIELARRRGWARPIDWDDIDTDEAPSIDPPTPEDDVDDVLVQTVVDEGRSLRLTRAERHIAVRTLNGRRYNDQEISRMLLVSSKTIARDRELLGLPPVEEAYIDLDARRAAAA